MIAPTLRKTQPAPKKNIRSKSAPSALNITNFTLFSQAGRGPQTCIFCWLLLWWQGRGVSELLLRFPVSHDTVSGSLARPQNSAMPPLLLCFAWFHTGTFVPYPFLKHIARSWFDTLNKTSTKEFCETTILAETIACIDFVWV